MRARLAMLSSALLAAALIGAAAPEAAFGWTLTVNTLGTGSGTVGGAGFSCAWDGATKTGDCTETYAGTTTVGLPTTPTGSSTVSWQGCTRVDGNQCLVENASSDRTVTVTFTKGFTLTVLKAGTGAGTVTSTPSGVSCGVTCIVTFASGTVVTLQAVAATGSELSSWSLASCPGTNPCAVTMDQARSVTATFDLVPPSVTLTVVKEGKGTVTSDQPGFACASTCSVTVPSGTQVTLTATPAAGYELVRFESCDQAQGNVCVQRVDAAETVTVVFADDVVDAEVRGAFATRGPLGGRIVDVEIRADETVDVRVTLLRGGRVLAVKHVAHFRPWHRTVLLRVQAWVAGGPARVRVVLTDGAGNTSRFEQPVILPRA